MKLKTLLVIFILLCVSVFAIACGEDDTTTAEQIPGNTTAATTANTTKATTKVTSCRCTPPVLTTTVYPAELKPLLPEKLPDSSTFDIHTRLGLETEDDYMSFKGEKYADLTWPANGGVYGKCISFTSNKAYNNGASNRAEGTLELLDPFVPEGVKGVLWYVDASNLTANGAGSVPEGQVAFSVTLNGNTFRSNKGGNGTAKGYYYKDGQWVETTNVNAGRMAVPDKFKGWLYVPITEYWKSNVDSAGELYEAASGLGLGNLWIETLNLYTEGYDYLTAGAIIFDEILFVK